MEEKKHAILRVKNYVVYLAISIKQSGWWTCMKIGAKPNKIKASLDRNNNSEIDINII